MSFGMHAPVACLSRTRRFLLFPCFSGTVSGGLRVVESIVLLNSLSI